jgi:hypothetical protein
MLLGGGRMAVLITADVPGQTRDGYDGMLAALGEPLRQATGFIAHFAMPAADGWTVMELWETQEDANRFFATHVHPNLPEGVRPRRSFAALHSLIRG